MNELIQQIAEFLGRFRLGELGMSAVRAAVIYAGFVVVVYVLEMRAGLDRARYRSRHFLNDIGYTLIYRGGFYNVFVLAAITNALGPHLAPLRLNLLRGLPWQIGLAIFWVGGDLAMYWWHRLQHANRFLWAFHTVHHSQEQLTLLTASRRHPIEKISVDVLIFVVLFDLILGIPTRGWLPIAAVITGITTIQHSPLDWRLGPLYRIVVSPRFHAFHHSADPAHANANYGFLFSFWDYLFGTAVPEQARPTRFGVDETEVNETMQGQLIAPFRLLWRWRRRPAPKLDTRPSQT